MIKKFTCIIISIAALFFLALPFSHLKADYNNDVALGLKKNVSSSDLTSNSEKDVLAINTNKSTYLKDEEVYVQMAVLDDKGQTICDANLKLEIISPDNKVSGVTVQKSSDCGSNDSRAGTDYISYYYPDETGEYRLNLTNLDNDISITDSFLVQESAFSIERIGPTRVYPVTNYEMKIIVIPHQDFQGLLVERTPQNFNIIAAGAGESIKKKDANEIQWQVNLKKGERYEFSYEFDPPDISPQLDFLGPLTFRSAADDKIYFEESRQWQIAVDAYNVIQVSYRWANDDGGEIHSWYNPSWNYRKPVMVTNAMASQLDNFQVSITLDTNALINSVPSKMQSNCNDLRFTDTDGVSEIPYWIEFGCNTAATKIWIKVPSIAASRSKLVYMYYGNPGAVSGVNGDNTFDGFDDFLGSSLDLTKWHDWNPYSWGSISVANSILTIHGPITSATQYVRGVLSNNAFSFSNHVIEIYSRWNFTGTLSTYLDYQSKSIRITDQYSPATLYAGNQYYFEYLRQWGLASYVHKYNFTKVIDGSSSTVKTVSLNNDVPVSYEWEKYLWYSGPNEKGYRSTNGSTFNSFWSATDATWSLPTSKYWGITLQAKTRLAGANADFYVDWIRIRKYAATEPSVSIGAETAKPATFSSWKAPENTAIAGQATNTNIRLRFSIKNSGLDPATMNFRLQVAPKGGAASCESVAAANFSDVPTTTGGCGTAVACMTNSSRFNNNDSTTNQLSASGNIWVAGKMIEDPANQAAAITLNLNNFTEIEYNFQLTNKASTGTTYCFRVTNDLNSYASVATVTTDSQNVWGFAWSENVGWISFNNTSGGGGIDYGVDIDFVTGILSGYAWSENIGWISFNRSDAGVPPNPPFNGAESYIAKVDLNTNNLSGWARACVVFQSGCSGALKSNNGGWDGWIKLRCYGAECITSNYGVWIDTPPDPAEFRGWAWGSDVLGWISFNKRNCDLDINGFVDVACGGDNTSTPIFNYKVALTNRFPQAFNLSINNNLASYCGRTAPLVILYWNFSDPDTGNPQTAYQVQVDNNSDFSSPEVDSGMISNSSNSYTLDTLLFNTTYYWRVRVWNGIGLATSWIYPPSPAGNPTAAPGTSFKTYVRPPNPNFTHNPAAPNVGEQVIFTDQSICYNVGGGSYNCNTNAGNRYIWDFGDGLVFCTGANYPQCNICDSNIYSNCRGNVFHTYAVKSTPTVTLTITDSVGVCSGAGDSPVNVGTSFPNPKWKEIPPASIVSKTLDIVDLSMR